MPTEKYGYMGKICRVDLTTKQVTYEFPEDSIVRDYIGGNGLGIYYVYREVPPGVEWSDPENRVCLMTGPLTATVGPTGGYSIVTKGPMTNGAVAAQAQGMFGAFLRLCGLDGLIIQGASPEPVYLYIHDDSIEIRDAKHLMGMDTWEATDAIEQELDKTEKRLSVLAIGPAGENLVRFACTLSDRGHVCAHNGPGAVLGSKNIKAVAVERGSAKIPVADRDTLRKYMRDIIENKTKQFTNYHIWGTAKSFESMDAGNILPVKNYLESDGRPYYNLERTYYGDLFDMKHVPCWGCAFKHCHRITVKDGPYKGYVGDEQEYENIAAFGSIIAQPDPVSATVLGNMADKLGMDCNELGWLVAWVMECYEKGYITKEDLDGIELSWGNAAGVEKLLENIAYRRGYGDKLAEGTMRAAIAMGGNAQDCAIFTKKGNTPRGHDHRTTFNHIIDTACSSMGSDEIAALLATPASVGLPPETQRNTVDGSAGILAGAARLGAKQLHDSLVLCSLGIAATSTDDYVKLLSSATGWDYTFEEASRFALRNNNLLRAFGYRHGHTKEMDEPSKRYASAALKGPEAGKEMYPVWDEARDNYYRNMGWDVETGKPLPETLTDLGLDYVIEDLWGEQKANEEDASSKSNVS